MVSLATPRAMRPPPTPVSKPPPRPAMSLKRNSSYLDTDDESQLSQTAKRLRVSFDDHVDVRIMPEWDDKSFELVKEEVRVGIEQHLAPPEQRDDTQYAKLLHLLSHDPFSAEALETKSLEKYIAALAGRISALGECGKLVMAALDVSWLGRSQNFVDNYRRFLLLLASSNTKFIPAIVERLVSSLKHMPAFTGRLPGETVVARADMYSRLHDTIHFLLSRSPSAGTVLRRALKHHFPNDADTSRTHQRYQRHLLRLADESPELKTEILSIIMEHLVTVDVEIQRELDDMDLEDDELLRKLSSADGDGAEDESEGDDGDSVSESELTMTEEELRLRDVRLKVKKMDDTQDMLFEYFSSGFEPEKTPDDNSTYQQLVSFFDSYILPNRSRHAQFLLFHFAQTSPAYAENFVQVCLGIINDRQATTVRRVTACAYVASFVSRGAQVTRKSVRAVVNFLCAYLEVIREVWEPDCRGPDRRSYALYYAVFQALLYIFCFRWRDLVVLNLDDSQVEDILAENRDLPWLPRLKEALTRNAQSTLNPLKVCSPAIVTEFAKIANHLRFLYIYSLLERNKRVRLGQLATGFHQHGVLDIGRRETAFDRKFGDAHHQLEAYFPFDPYQLPVSKKWLEGEYNEWKLPSGMKDDEDEEEDERSEDEEANEADEDEDLAEDYDSEDEPITDGFAALAPPTALVSVGS